MTSEATRESVCQSLRVYMSRTGWTLAEIAERASYSHQTLRQFISGARYGDGDGETAARRLARFMEENPAPLPESPGKLYETAATREMGLILERVREGAWGTLYGPAGAQKTFLLRYRFAEAARLPEPDLVLVEVDSAMSPRALFARIAQGLAAPYALQTDKLRQGILYALRRRSSTVALVLDEAQLLYSRIDTLEALRRLGDLAGGRMGILVCGNEQVIKLFEKRRRNYFEQWRSRIEQIEARVLGPTPAEAVCIVEEELAGIKDRAVAVLIEGASVADPISKKRYVNARRLFNAIRDFRGPRRRLQ